MCSDKNEKTAALYLKFPTFIRRRQLEDHIGKYGFGCNVVWIDMHNNKYTGKPAGSAKVLVMPHTLMDHFISVLHGTCLPGKYQQLLSVQPYVQIKDKKSSPHKVFVGSGLPPTITKEDVRKHFEQVRDAITKLQIVRERK